ncbi:MAG: hypothetical protein AB7S68_05940 [Polyangiaceae bacterium]
MSKQLSQILLPLLFTLTACGVPEPPGSTGGVDTQETECGRGLVVIGSDYQSTNVSLLDPQGNVLSSSFISSASSGVRLNAPLSGDVVAPSTRLVGDRAVLLDRYPAAVITWIDLQTAKVTAQLGIGTGFSANPHDYVELSSELAVVTRFEPNPNAGKQAFDEGNDLLLIDPSKPAIVGRIDLTNALGDSSAGYFPRPDKLRVVGDQLYVLASAYSADFSDSLESRIVRVDLQTRSVVEVLTLDGLHGCAGLALSPSHHQLAVSCSGPFGGDAVIPEGSGLALVNIEGELSLERSIPAAELATDPLAYSLDYVSDDTLLFTTFGRFDPGGTARPDRLIQLDLNDLSTQELITSASDPFTLGDVRCNAACGSCFLADAGRGGVVHHFGFEVESAPGQQRLVRQGPLTLQASTKPDSQIGLPPRYLGAF